MNKLFSNYVTGSAFRVDLSTRMVHALLRCANGEKVNTGHYGADSLVKRGLLEPIEGQEKRTFKELRLTEPGIKIAELCIMAGLREDV